MRKIIAAIYLTLDGVMEHPIWTGPYFNDELGAAQHRLLFESDALLLGRVTYQGFALAWPNVPDTDGFANRINSLPKYVASRTLATTEWNATLLEGNDVATAVAALKQQPGQNVLFYVSGELADTVGEHNLSDEYRFRIFPVVLGKGQRFFREGSATDLQLVDTQTTSTGVSILTYRRAG